MGSRTICLARCGSYAQSWVTQGQSKLKGTKTKPGLDSSGESWMPWWCWGCSAETGLWAGQDERGVLEQAEKRGLTLLQECFGTGNAESWPWLFHTGEGKISPDEVCAPGSPNLISHLINLSQAASLRLMEKCGWLMLPLPSVVKLMRLHRLLGLSEGQRGAVAPASSLCVLSLKTCWSLALWWVLINLGRPKQDLLDNLKRLSWKPSVHFVPFKGRRDEIGVH